MIWVLSFLLFTGCSSFSYLSEKIAKAPSEQTYTEIVDPLAFSEIIIPYAVELKYAERLRFEDSAIFYDETALRFRVIFSSQEILELCEARELMVTVVEGLLARLNASGGILNCFDHSPIVAEDLELYFSFESFDIEYNDPTYIAWMSLHDGLVRYYSGLIKNHQNDYWNARIEPYYKSLQFVLLTDAAEETFGPKRKKPSEESRYLDL